MILQIHDELIFEADESLKQTTENKVRYAGRRGKFERVKIRVDIRSCFSKTRLDTCSKKVLFLFQNHHS